MSPQHRAIRHCSLMKMATLFSVQHKTTVACSAWLSTKGISILKIATAFPGYRSEASYCQTV